MRSVRDSKMFYPANVWYPLHYVTAVHERVTKKKELRCGPGHCFAFKLEVEALILAFYSAVKSKRSRRLRRSENAWSTANVQGRDPKDTIFNCHRGSRDRHFGVSIFSHGRRWLKYNLTCPERDLHGLPRWKACPETGGWWRPDSPFPIPPCVKSPRANLPWWLPAVGSRGCRN